MKVACDIRGTLRGHYRENVLLLLNFLRAAGAEIVVWTNGMTLDARKEIESLPFPALPSTKYSAREAQEMDLTIFDVMIDDDPTSTYLAGKELILACDIPNTAELIVAKYGYLLEPK